MIEIAGLAIATFFATVSPLDVSAIFTALTTNLSAVQKRSIAIRGVLIATGILVVFALIGEILLSSLGISMAALRTTGGILLLLIGIDMAFARISGGTSTTKDEEQEAILKSDISVFPLATPLMAGPGSMGAAILLMANQEGNIIGQVIIIVSLLIVMLGTLISLLLAGRIYRLFGVTGMHVVTRIMGVLLSALAVQFVFDGIKGSGLIGG